MTTQPQLLHMALNKKDVVYTPDKVARNVVEFFNPTGRILEPCSGDGAFLKYLPTADWCEIEKGRDFFACVNHYDWIIGNPPFSLIDTWLNHTFNICDNAVYILPFPMFYSTLKRLKKIFNFGVRSQYVLGTMKEIGMLDNGFLCGAFHFQRDYKGGMFTSFYEVTK